MPGDCLGSARSGTGRFHETGFIGQDDVWQYPADLIALTLLVTGYRSLRGRSAVQGFSPALAAGEVMAPATSDRSRSFAADGRQVA